ncbi:hypothetical protein BC829DRAFT_128141 [Chytridium lagenaria]|nr:hypothetical protein BC829DRAFT_128141 [Chytridium lagenaria]
MSGLPSSSSSSSSATDTQTALQAAAALHAGGRPSDPIWNHFNRQPVPGKKYYEADCKYCQKIFKVGKPTELKFHIIDCRLAPEDVLVMVRALLPQDDEGNIIKPAWHKRTSGNAFGEEDGPPTRSPYSRSATAQRLSMVERGLVPGPVRSGSVVASQDGLDTDGEGGGGAPQAAPAPRVVRDNIAGMIQFLI